MRRKDINKTRKIMNIPVVVWIIWFTKLFLLVCNVLISSRYKSTWWSRPDWSIITSIHCTNFLYLYLYFFLLLISITLRSTRQRLARSRAVARTLCWRSERLRRSIRIYVPRKQRSHWVCWFVWWLKRRRRTIYKLLYRWFRRGYNRSNKFLLINK